MALVSLSIYTHPTSCCRDCGFSDNPICSSFPLPPPHRLLVLFVLVHRWVAIRAVVCCGGGGSKNNVASLWLACNPQCGTCLLIKSEVAGKRAETKRISARNLSSTLVPSPSLYPRDIVVSWDVCSLCGETKNVNLRVLSLSVSIPPRPQP